MPWIRYNDLDEARRALWADEVDANYLRRLKSLWAFATRMRTAPFPRGVHKYRSIEEANEAREAWNMEQVRRRRESRQKS